MANMARCPGCRQQQKLVVKDYITGKKVFEEHSVIVGSRGVRCPGSGKAP